MLTAGLGTRLRPYTETLPKPCLPFLNLPLMNYGFLLAQKSGFKNFLFNTHHLANEIENNVASLKDFCKSSQISDETSQILGSGGALWKAAPILKDYDYFLIANGDEVLIPKDNTVLDHLVSQFKKDDALCTLLTCDHPELLKTLKPVWVNNGEVKAFGMEKPDQDVKPVHYTGYKIFSKRILDMLPDGESNIFYDVVTKAMAQGEKVTHFHLNQCGWFETGSFNFLIEATQIVANQYWDFIQETHSFYSNSLEKI